MGLVISLAIGSAAVAVVGVAAAIIHARSKAAEAILATRTAERRQKMTAKGLDPDAVYFPLVGLSGAGKSDFCNAVRGKKIGEEGFAKTGSTETTMEASFYLWTITEKGTKIYIVDLPGCNTSSSPLVGYVEKYNLSLYDAPLLFCTRRVPASFASIAQELHAQDLPTFFVRNQISHDVENAPGDGKTPTQVVEEARAELIKEVRKKVPSANRGYVIDSRELMKVTNAENEVEQVRLGDSLELIKDIEAFYRAKLENTRASMSE